MKDVVIDRLTKYFRVILFSLRTQEAWLTWLLHGRLGNRSLADRWLSDWFTKLTEYEGASQDLAEVLKLTELPDFPDFRECIRSFMSLRERSQIAYEECEHALKDHKLSAAFSALCGFQHLKASQEKFAGIYLSHFPENAGPSAPGASDPPKAA